MQLSQVASNQCARGRSRGGKWMRPAVAAARISGSARSWSRRRSWRRSAPRSGGGGGSGKSGWERTVREWKPQCPSVGMEYRSRGWIRRSRRRSISGEWNGVAAQR